MRLDKFLAESNIGSRSQVKDYIKKGLVSVNGDTIKSPEFKIDENKDYVTYNKKPVKYARYEYFMLNKPAGVVSAARDNIDKTVIELIEDKIRNDLFPAGRLDKDTEGLLIITNDGELAHNMLSPKKHVDKTYYAVIDGEVTGEDVRRFSEGLDIGDDKPAMPAELKILKSADESEIELTIQEGRFHQVKRMFEAVGKNVIYLKRISMGGLKLDDKLLTGDYRRLTNEELDILRRTQC